MELSERKYEKVLFAFTQTMRPGGRSNVPLQIPSNFAQLYLLKNREGFNSQTRSEMWTLDTRNNFLSERII